VINIVTFPFLFGMMFGDMGHGSIMLLFGAILVLFADKLKGTAVEFFLPLRYLVFLMGLMATYCGLIYNEWFAMPAEIFPSCFDLENRVNDTMKTIGNETVGTNKYYYQKYDFKCNYPIGYDPVWMMSSEALTFSNSIKMKVAVIIGIAHMTMGVIIKGTNLIYHKHWSHFIFEVVTGLVILLFLFGWMDMLIFLKWFTVIDIDNPDDDRIKNANMPSIISIMITMAFNFGNYTEGSEEIPLVGDSLAFQYRIAIFLLICVMIACPLMLFAIPCCFRHGPSKVEEANELEFADIQGGDMNQRLIGGEQSNRIQRLSGSDLDVEDNSAERHRQMKKLDQQLKALGKVDEAVNFGEAFVNQMIETIEFVLGSVSNTASYLRLWALSLAHGQLADVFLHQIFLPTFKA